MIVGILQADSVLPQYQAAHGNYPGMFERLLSTHDVQCKHYNVEAMEYPDIDECDGYLITGSKSSVYDDEPWIVRLSEFCLLYTSPSPRDQRGSGFAGCG